MEEIRNMTMGEDELSLENDFEYSSREEWEKVAKSSFKGGDISKFLKTLTYEGIEIDAIYSEPIHGISVPGIANFRRGQSVSGHLTGGWEVCQRIRVREPEDFNIELIKGLESGLNSVFVVPDHEYGIGLRLNNPDDLKKALYGVDISRYPVVFEPGVKGREYFEFLIRLGEETTFDLSKINGAINFDPLSVFFKTGKDKVDLDTNFKEMAVMFRVAEEKKMRVRLIGVSVLPYHNSGASAVHELAIALSAGVDYIQAMGEKGLSPEQIVRSISFMFGIGSNFFMEISKLRVFRVLWNRIVNEYGVKGDSDTIQIHAETSLFNKSVLDPFVNVLRATTETFSAVVGGADRITTNPHDIVFSESKGSADRIARNIQMILREESHIHKMIDPAGGSYYVEKLTDDLTEKSWEFFLEIERRGGIQKSIEDGFIKKKIVENGKKLISHINRREKIMVGTNFFSNTNEDIKNGNRLSELSRLSLTFEKMRTKVAKLIENSMLPEEIIIAVNEPFTKVKPRVEYIKGFFGSAGFKSKTVKLEGTPEEKADTVLSKKGNIVVMCATDEDYPEVIGKIVPLLKKRSEKMIVAIAGNPANNKSDYIKYGVDIFVHRGVDLPEEIDKMISMSGVENG